MWWNYLLVCFIGFVMGGIVWFEIYYRIKVKRELKK
jgi:hypothetical protein